MVNKKEKQRRKMGIALSIKEGETPRSYSREAARIADSMSEKKLKKFASKKPVKEKTLHTCEFCGQEIQGKMVYIGGGVSHKGCLPDSMKAKLNKSRKHRKHKERRYNNPEAEKSDTQVKDTNFKVEEHAIKTTLENKFAGMFPLLGM